MQSTIYTDRLISSLSVVAINNTFVRGKGRPSYNLIAIDRDLVVNSRSVPVIVKQEPAQPVAALYSPVTTSFRDSRKQQERSPMVAPIRAARAVITDASMCQLPRLCRRRR